MRSDINNFIYKLGDVMKRVISSILLFSSFICFNLKACPLCTIKLAYRNNKAPFFSNTYYKPGQRTDEINNAQEEIPAQKASEDENEKNKLRQVQEIEAENLAEDMGEL